MIDITHASILIQAGAGLGAVISGKSSGLALLGTTAQSWGIR